MKNAIFRISAVVAITSALCMASGAASADGVEQGHHGHGAVHAACKDDAQRFCKDVKPGGGRLLACLNEHSKDLSPTCSKALADARAAH